MLGANRVWAGAAVVGLLCATSLVLGRSEAAFKATTSSSGNQWSAGQLLPPGTPTATYSCNVTVRRIAVNWSASPSTLATDYRVERSVNGAGYTFSANVAYGTNTWTDTSVNGSTSYTYRLRAERAGTTWVSSYTAASNTVTTPALCL